MKLSEAITIRQDERWEETRRQQEELERNAIKRNQREQKAKEAFLLWFYQTTGIDDFENARLFVQENLDGMHAWFVFANGGQVRFNGQFSVTEDGDIEMHPFTDTGEIWHAVVDHFYTDYEDFTGAAIYAMNLPREKPRDNALLAVGD